VKQTTEKERLLEKGGGRSATEKGRKEEEQQPFIKKGAIICTANTGERSEKREKGRVPPRGFDIGKREVRKTNQPYLVTRPQLRGEGEGGYALQKEGRWDRQVISFCVVPQLRGEGRGRWERQRKGGGGEKEIKGLAGHLN